jgi:AbrB family looped-hinge helix DNA binding protein
MAEVKLSSKNQIVVPKEVRDQLQLKSGDELMIVARGDYFVAMRKPKSFHAATRGIAKGLYPEDYLKKERASWR